MRRANELEPGRTPRRYVGDKREQPPSDQDKQNDMPGQQQSRRARHYQPNLYSPANLKKQYKYSDRDRKFSYLQQKKQSTALPVIPTQADMMKKIRELEYEIECQQNRYRVLEERTIESQKEMLGQLTGFEEKYHKLRMEKKQQDEELQLLRAGQGLQEDVSVLADYKKIKGFTSALIDMRRKVEGEDGDLKAAWKWIKNVVGEYEASRQHAAKWKKAYQQLYGQDSQTIDASFE